MPTPTAIVFRPGRRSRPGRLSRPGRRGNRSLFRFDFAGRCSTSWDTASSSASSAPPVSAAARSLKSRARAASARASAVATSSSPASVMSVGSSRWSASDPSASCTEKELITSAWPNAVVGQLLSCPLHAEMLVRKGRGGAASQWPGADGRLAEVILSNQENFLFGCGKVIGCDSSWQWLPRWSAPVC
jgi:hypothetical protein